LTSTTSILRPSFSANPRFAAIRKKPESALGAIIACRQTLSSGAFGCCACAGRVTAASNAVSSAPVPPRRDDALSLMSRSMCGAATGRAGVRG